MRRVLKWVGVILSAAIAAVILIAVGLYVNTIVRLDRTYNVPSEAVPIPTDTASIARGKHLTVIHCMVCHGDNLAGSVIFEDPSLGKLTATNLTSGRGGVGGRLSDMDFVRATRHGVGPDGKPLFSMPSEAFYYLSDADMGAIVAYVKSVPPVEHDTSNPVVMSPLARILISAGAFGKVISAEDINHTSPRPTPAAPGVTAAHGDYLVKTGQCRTCHGADLAGGKDPDPKAPPAPNLTQGGELRVWSEQDFMRSLRTGVTPGGHQLGEFMPWKYVGQMTDDEHAAIWLYLKSLPATASK